MPLSYELLTASVPFEVGVPRGPKDGQASWCGFHKPSTYFAPSPGQGAEKRYQENETCGSALKLPQV